MFGKYLPMLSITTLAWTDYLDELKQGSTVIPRQSQ